MNAKIEKFLDTNFGMFTMVLIFSALLSIIIPPLIWLFSKMVAFIIDQYLAYLSIFF